MSGHKCDQSSTGQVLKEKCDFLRPPILPLLRARNVNMSVCFGPEDKSHMREAAEPACAPALKAVSGWLTAGLGTKYLYNYFFLKVKKIKNIY